MLTLKEVIERYEKRTNVSFQYAEELYSELVRVKKFLDKIASDAYCPSAREYAQRALDGEDLK